MNAPLQSSGACRRVECIQKYAPKEELSKESSGMQHGLNVNITTSHSVAAKQGGAGG